MYKQSTGGRSNRSRKFKVKHVLQISVLLALCLWFIYQAKQSHGKKTQSGVGNDPKMSQKTGNVHEAPKLGRKDLPQSNETDKSNKMGDNEVEDGEIERNENEAQAEKLYKADDASSEVTHMIISGQISGESSTLPNTSLEPSRGGSSLVVKNILLDSLNETVSSSVTEKPIQGRPRFPTQDDRWISTMAHEIRGSGFEALNNEHIDEVPDLIDTEDAEEIQTEESINTEDSAAK
ncbi:unnamed protein product [Cuscuta epithymum]|uniref:Uncharacterized protein n=1 Tax=Cuscuta epithymum TaxID=186058 RepID=A0AAV0CDD9_9ASTE|nr:unnamed protein product [Cuscuta epithymum]